MKRARRACARVVVAAVAVLASCSAPPGTEFAPAVVDRAGAAAASIDAANLERHVRAIYDLRQTEDAPVSAFSEQAPLSRVKTIDYVQAELVKAGLAPRVETATASVGPIANVIADVPGQTGELVLLTGHLDAWHKAGADDNASAVAVILEAARVLAKANARRTIRFVAFDREEEGLLGSAAYREAHASDAVRMVLNMDCVGFASHEAGSQDAPPGFGIRDVADFLAVVASADTKSDLGGTVKLASKLANVPELLGIAVPGDGRYAGTGDFLRSDHAVFWLAGVRSLFFTDTADFRNANYHTPGDKPDTLDYAFLAGAARTIVGATLAFAEAE